MSPARHLLLYVQVALFQRGGELLVESQALNGLRRWAEHFESVTVMMPLNPGEPPKGWSPAADLGELLARVEILPLPMAYKASAFARHMRATSRVIEAAINRADYLCFAIGGFFGDWGAVASLIAYSRGRRFAVWTDRVESDVTWRLRNQGSWRRRVWRRAMVFPMRWLEHAVIRRAGLGLFHGRETFEAYAPFCRGQSHVVHNIHIRRGDHISVADMAAKKVSAAQGRLKICYVGRLDPMKGALDWVEVLGCLAAAGVDFEAVWLGQGPERAVMEARIAALGLGYRVLLPGFASDRSEVLTLLRQSHVMLFCHKTPESPRCLIESLISATPIIGYQGAFAAELTAGQGGGRLVGLNDIRGLADQIIALDRNRAELLDLMDRARADGALFDDETVFQHRSDLIKAVLPLPD